MARNAWFGVALLALTTVAACGGEVAEVKAAQAAQAQLAKVRARTDSIRQSQEARMAAVADTTARSESAGAQTSLFNARVDPRTRARPGERLRLAVQPLGFHFFDVTTGDNLLASAPALA